MDVLKELEHEYMTNPYPDELKINYIVKNKLYEDELNKNNLSLNLRWYLKPSWLSGKYLGLVEVTNTITKKKIYLEYICSITKKEVHKENITEYVYLNHLDIKELVSKLNT